MVFWIVKEVLLVKADGVKSEPDLKGRSKTGRKSIIDMDSQEAQIITDEVELGAVVDLGMSKLTACLLVNNRMEVGELPLVCISNVGTCIAKLKPLNEKVKNKKQASLDINAPTCKSRFLWCLIFSLRTNLIVVEDAWNCLVKKKIIKTKEGRLPKTFDPADFTDLFADQFVTWDEFHRKVVAGTGDFYARTLYKDWIMKFPRDDKGKLDM